jgi:hypothetical protein
MQTNNNTTEATTTPIRYATPQALGEDNFTPSPPASVAQSSEDQERRLKHIEILGKGEESIPFTLAEASIIYHCVENRYAKDQIVRKQVQATILLYKWYIWPILGIFYAHDVVICRNPNDPQTCEVNLLYFYQVSQSLMCFPVSRRTVKDLCGYLFLLEDNVKHVLDKMCKMNLIYQKGDTYQPVDLDKATRLNPTSPVRAGVKMEADTMPMFPPPPTPPPRLQ